MVHPNRRRYVVFHILSPQDIGKGLLIKLIRDRTRPLPEERFQEIKPWLVYFKKGWAIVRTGHRGSSELLKILNGLDGTNLREGPLKLRTVGVSGTLRGAFYKHIPLRAREGLTYALVEENAPTMSSGMERTQ